MSITQDSIKDDVFKLVQNFLKTPPLIIWGSGATVTYGLPTMSKLSEDICNSLPSFDREHQNLEVELGKEKYKDSLPAIKNIIWTSVNDANLKAMQELVSDYDSFEPIKCMIDKFREAHPQVLNFVTTNYDYILENVMSFYGVKFTDGFSGQDFSKFDIDAFKAKSIVNLIKVHGSLKWFFINDEVRYLTNPLNDVTSAIIAPGKNKYQECYNTPYRELIQKTDELIKKASSFFVVGFGFNDEHLTPKVKQSVNQGKPIVLITKLVTTSTFEELKNAKQYILFEEDNICNSKTKITYKKNNEMEPTIIQLDGTYWSLKSFISEVL